jgi:hypothetical protein
MSESETNPQDEDAEVQGFFPEEGIAPLSDRDRDFFLSLLENPPEPTPALRELVALYRKGPAS